MTRGAWVVHKFGGTSLADATRYKEAAKRLKEDLAQGDNAPKCATIVSSMAGVTNQLLSLIELAQQRQEGWEASLHAIQTRHLAVAQELLSGEAFKDFSKRLTQDLDNMAQVLRAIWLLQHASAVHKDWLVGFGESWSARLLAGWLQANGQPTLALDAREVLFVKHSEATIEIRWQRSRETLQERLRAHPEEWLVVTGFIASLDDGTPTTLKRNGSDFSASIFGALLDAQSITIWTDVDGVFSADPRRVPEAERLSYLSWKEATELAYFGASVLHPHAMTPAMSHNIPLIIRNSLQPSNPGTRIEGHSQPKEHAGRRLPVKGFSTIDHMALINVEGTGMMGVPGIANRLFGALREVGVSVVMISQASSEHSICFAVPEEQAEQASQVVEEVFAHERSQKRIHIAPPVAPCSILAAVGDAMVEQPGVAAQFFDALGKAGINVRAIAQGASERNISAVIDQVDSTRALRAVHAGFFLSQQTLSVGLVGPGLIGKVLLKQLHAQAKILREQFQIDLRIRGIARSRKMLLSETHIPLDQWETLMEEQGQPTDLDAFATHIKAEHLPHSVIIDCTANTQATAWYPNWLGQRIHVLTPNKKAFSSDFSIYKVLRQRARSEQVHIFYEATVGAGLPVISTLRDLLQTGDEIEQIEGVFSGTLAYIFNQLSTERPFSEVVKQAKEQGYTEPDPRDDLSGMDVARKLVILAREVGLSLELDQIDVQNLVPTPLREEPSVQAVLERLPDYDQSLQKQVEQADEKGEVLRYVGSLQWPDGEGAPQVKVALRPYPLTHAFARITGSDNIIAIRTRRYHTQPLIIQGPGAGPEVTAGGVFADLLRLAAHLGAPS